MEYNIRDIFDLQQASRACGYCTTPLTGGALISSLPCATAAKTRIASNCKLRFCNRLCLTRAARIHPLLCFAANSSVTLLLAFARQRRWMAGHAVALVYARLLLANEQGRTKDLQEDLAFVRALAAMGVKERWIAAGFVFSLIFNYFFDYINAEWKTEGQDQNLT